jgi:hypothetical protein
VKDQYVGDIGDFAKYQLLRVCRPHFEKLVVAWMLTEPDGRGDGNRISYLQQADRGDADPELFEILASVVDGGNRSVAAIEMSGALEGCHFHRDPVPFAASRPAYFEVLSNLLDDDSLVFLDPDNGIEVRSAPKSSRRSRRYVYWDEICLLRDTGSSVVIYQHFPYVARPAFVERLLGRLRDELGEGYRAFAAHTSLVSFFFGIREDRANAVEGEVAGRCGLEPLLNFVR